MRRWSWVRPSMRIRLLDRLPHDNVSECGTCYPNRNAAVSVEHAETRKRKDLSAGSSTAWCVPEQDLHTHRGVSVWVARSTLTHVIMWQTIKQTNSH
jgi:hypothetical protein